MASISMRKTESNRLSGVFEPTSIVKVTRVLDAMSRSRDQDDRRIFDHFTPNAVELSELYEQAKAENLISTPDCRSEGAESFDLASDLLGLGFPLQNGILQASLNLIPWFPNIWLKIGRYGVIRFSKDLEEGKANPAETYSYRSWKILGSSPSQPPIRVEHFKAAFVDEQDMVSTTGAGDSFVGGLVAALAKKDRGKKLEREDVAMALRCAAASLLTEQAVSAQVTKIGQKWRDSL